MTRKSNTCYNYSVELTDKNIDEVLAKEKPDVVVMATGARPARDGTGAVTCNPIPGWDTEKGATCFHTLSEREFNVEADNIILATTKYSNTELYDLFKQRGVECHLIGDARAPRWIWNTTHDGYKLAREI
jgi:hypothetical protein